MGFVKFEVDKNGSLSTEILLPDIQTSVMWFSTEVVAIWQQNELADLDQTTYYTDSNGLELVERTMSRNKTIPE